MGRYRLLRPLGSGSIALVFECEDKERTDTTVAIKLLHPDLVTDERLRERIRREHRRLTTINHPNVVRVYEFVESSDKVGYTMELASGGDAASRIGSSMTVEEVRALLAGCCRGAQAIHDRGLIHRNIKPENVLLDRSGAVRLADLCCAADLNDREIAENEVVATLDYVPPEYLRDRRLDVRTDLYALGMLGYELLTGRTPFAGQTVYKTMMNLLHSEPKPPTAYRTDCPPSLASAILRAISREPAERFGSAREMEAAL